MVEWTRGVTVRTTAARVWPWLAQMGYGRGGWYTPEWIDLFANRWVFGVRAPFPKSADRLLPEHQHLAIGDLICDGPDYASYFRVEHVDPPRALVSRSIRHPRRGSPIDIDDPESPTRVEQQLRTGGTYVDFTWALALNPLPGDRTRLLVRTRANYAPSGLRHLVLRDHRRDVWHRHAACDRQACGNDRLSENDGRPERVPEWESVIAAAASRPRQEHPRLQYPFRC